MSLYAKTVARYGVRIRQTGLVKRMAAITTVRSFREMTSGYLIDESKANYVSPDEAAAKGGDYLRKTMLGEAPMRPDVDYRAGASRVWSFGRANHPVYRSVPSPLALTDEQRLAIIVEAWCKDRAKAKVVAHHLVFSLDPRLTAALGEREATKHLPLDDLLLDCVSNALLEYQCKFYPRDQLGFIAGVHHDRSHAHAHVLVHPITANGDRVNLSTNEVEERDGQRVNVQYQAHLKEAFSRRTDLLAEHCLGEEKRFTWVGRAPDARDRHLAREEMVLADRILDEPEVNVDGPLDVRVRAHMHARAKLLSLPNYANIIRRARLAQRQRIEHVIASGEEPEMPTLKFAEIEAEIGRASARCSEMSGRVASMFGAAAQEPDRAGPLFPPGRTMAVSRSSAFRHLRQSEAESLPTPLTTQAFLRRREARQMDHVDRMAETITEYAQAGRDYARIAAEQHVRLARSAAILLTTSAEITGHIPDFLEEPVAAAGIRLPDENLLAASVAQNLQAISREISQHFRPIENRPAPEPEDGREQGEIPNPEVGMKIYPGSFSSVLAIETDGTPLRPEALCAKRRPIVTPDI